MSSDRSQKDLESPRQPLERVVFGPFVLDSANLRLLRDGQPVPLTPKAFETLQLLLAVPGQLVTREQFLDTVWCDTAVEDGNLTGTIWMVRRALGEHEGWIQTVPRRGYMFTGPVEPPVPAAEPEPPRVLAPERTAPAHRLAAVAALLLATVLGGAAAVWFLAGRPASVTSGNAIHSIAVLPFRVLSSSPDEAYFADGMTDAVITDLASIAALRVVSHQSVRRFRNSDQPVAAIARELGVDAIVQGVVGRTGTRLRLTAQLVDPSSETHLWAATFDRDLGDVLAVQGELASAVAGAIQVRVSDPERSALAARRAVDPVVYDAYLRGRFFFAQRTEASLAKSRASYQRAIDVDRTFAPAYAGLAMAYSVSGFFGYLPPAEALAGLRQAATRALEIDPQQIDATVALASASLNHDWDWSGTLRAYDAIFTRSPNHAQARLWYGMTLSAVGRMDEALAERSRALAIEPLSLRFNTSVADTLVSMHRYDEAIARYRRTLELDAGFPSARLGLGIALLRTGQWDEAVVLIERADRDASDLRSRATLGHAYGAIGRRPEALAILSELLGHEGYVSPVYPAFVAAGLGDRDAAFADLERAYRDRSPLLIGLKFEPLFDPLRLDPRFVDLMRRMNLPAP
jgi:TolB-like protein/DNA-binding winged helix-turn-helix (wHTH) protein/Tfp pilus assembly protein PilF